MSKFSAEFIAAAAGAKTAIPLFVGFLKIKDSLASFRGGSAREARQRSTMGKKNW